MFSLGPLRKCMTGELFTLARNLIFNKKVTGIRRHLVITVCHPPPFFFLCWREKIFLYCAEIKCTL